MFASELMEAIRKEPEKYEGKRYEIPRGNCITGAGKPLNAVKVHNGKLLVDNDSGNYAFASSYCELEEIKQPVTWQEAIAAWVNGKAIYVCLEHGTKYSYAAENNKLSTSHGGIPLITKQEIKSGTWYIED